MWRPILLPKKRRNDGTRDRCACRHGSLHPYEPFDPLTHAGDTESKGGALFNQWQQFVELRAGMRARQRDADGMEQLLAFDACRGLDLVHPGFEYLWPNVPGKGANAVCQFAQHRTGRVGRQHGCIFLVSPRRLCIESEDRSSLRGELVEMIDSGNKEGEQLLKPWTYGLRCRCFCPRQAIGEIRLC